MSWTWLEEDELRWCGRVVSSEGCFSSAERVSLDVSPVMSDRLQPVLGEAATNSAGPDSFFFFG